MGDQVEGVAGEASKEDGQTTTLPPLTPQLQGTLIGSNPQYARQTSVNRATPRSARALSRKLQDVIKKQHLNIKEPGSSEQSKSIHEKFQPRNWKQLSERELKKLTLIERSRYLAYEPEPKEFMDKRREIVRRAVQTKEASQKDAKKGCSLEEFVQTEWDSGLVGYLKAADARLRLRSMRSTYERNKVDEIQHLIASQPSSIEAVRLKCLLQPPLQVARPREFLAKHERERCELLIEDERGLTINRKL